MTSASDLRISVLLCELKRFLCERFYVVEACIALHVPAMFWGVFAGVGGIGWRGILAHHCVGCVFEEEFEEKQPN
jgi:hypothetical protein